MPAEWEPHEATWIAWPHNRDDWPGRFAPIPWVYGEIVRKLSRVEKVRILVNGAALERQARRILRKVGAQMESVEFFECPTDRVWTRDYCPLFVCRVLTKMPRREVAAAAWRFNAWAKYDDWKRDAAVPAFVAARLGMSSWTPDMVLEGGSIDVNGAGSLLTTEECLLSEVQARNPGMTRRDIERRLRDYLGARPRDLAAQRHRRRRYPRPCGRHSSLRGAGFSGGGFGRGPIRCELRTSAREL